MNRRRTAGLLACAGGAAGLLVLAVPGAASAHVRVIPDVTTSGSYAELTFRVPTESTTASTVQVVVRLPQRTPLASVSVRPVPGWTATVTEADLPTPVATGGATVTRAPATVTWTASPAARIRPGQYQDFAISAGPLPAPGLLALPTSQVYSDGTTVNWAQPTVPGQAEPERPAPAFTVGAATAGAGGADRHGGQGEPAQTAAQTAARTAAQTAAQGSGSGTVDGVARALAALALAASAGAAVGAVVATRRRPR